MIFEKVQSSLQEQIWNLSVRRHSGPRVPRSGVILLCRVENGAEWIPSFLAHYRSIGISHMVFLDTGSTDATVSLLQGDDVTVYTTALPFKTHRLWMRRWLMRVCAPGTWTLNVDIDELFEYPLSSRMPISSLCAYLDRRGMTAMRTHMLDMFSSGVVGSTDAPDSAALLERFPWYDLSTIEPLNRPEYFGTELPSYRGGIRYTAFGGDHFWLTKEALIKVGCGAHAFERNEHVVYDARFADVTGVLLHFKFTKGFRSYVNASVERAQHWNESEEYKIYQRALLQNPHLTFKSASAEKWQGVDRLVEQGFLQVSDAYHQFAMGSSTAIPGVLSAACA